MDNNGELIHKASSDELPGPNGTAEQWVLYLLPYCSPEFLGRLKTTHITLVQRQLRLVEPTGVLGSNVVHSPG